ncbi:MAG: chaperone NapD [Magnetococcales bacterium]|nr:chaperone NapD [Magnetococcales bacterium]
MSLDENGPFALASAVIRARAERLPEVRTALRSIPGLDIHVESPHGALIITLEGTEPDPLASALHHIRGIDGVLTADLIYQHFEDDSEAHGKETEQ